MSDLESVADQSAEVFVPGSAESDGGGNVLGDLLKGADPRVLYGVLAVALLVVGVGLYEVLHTPASTVPALRPPPITAPVGPSVVAVAPEAPPLPEVATTGPTTRPDRTATATTLPAWYGLHPVAPVLPPEKINDEMVERALRRGVAFLKPRLVAGHGEDGVVNDPSMELGANSLATYALLHAGEAIDDSELGRSSPLIASALQRLKQVVKVDHDTATYSYSLRAQALALAGRDVDRPQLGKDQTWLLKAELRGAYSYDAQENPDSTAWDNSNSQYGVLGIWAASEVAIPAPARYWQDVERHWVSTQVDDGGWGYNGPQGSSTTMTAAGVTTLCVASEQEGVIGTGPAARRAPAPPAAPEHRAGPVKPHGPGGTAGGAPAPGPPVTPAALALAIDRGLAFLAKGNTILESNVDEGYTLYGVERAALATGFRFFGEHDWYRELGAMQIAAQSTADGSWSGKYGPGIGTAFRLLFLARGRQPLLMNKLKFAGDWNDRPRDVAKLVAYASARLERPFAWGVADLSRDWWTWLDAPVIYMSTDAAPTLSDADVRKLRAYSDAGGFMVLHNEFAAPEVDAFAAELARRLFPEYPLAKVAPTDLLYHTLYAMPPGKGQPPLMVVTNGTRPLLVYSPTDVSRSWVGWKAHDTSANPDLEIGLNLFVAAAGKSEFRNRLNTPYIDPSPVTPLGTVPVQQVTYAGGRCNPEPAAWVRFGRWFIDQTSLALDVRPTDVKGVSLSDGPIAVLTGNQPVDFATMDTHALADFVRGGGTLLIDADGGDKGFAKSVREGLLPVLFGGVAPTGMPLEHPVLAGTGDCMTPLPKPRLRKFASEQLGILNPPGVQYLTYGSGTVIVSDLDLTTALLHSSTYGVFGYTPEYADGLYKNAILWTLSRFQPPPTTAPAK